MVFTRTELNTMTMKKIVFAIAALAMINSVNVQAQDILGTLKNAAATAASKSDNSTVAAIGNLLGTSSVSAADLVGTWNYSQPAVAFESKNVLTNVGTAAASSAIEKKLATYLTKAGFTKGKVQLILNEDKKNGYVVYNKKKVPVNWSVNGSDLTLKVGTSAINEKLSSTSKLTNLTKYNSFKMNVKKSGSELQVAMKADKLMSLLQSILSAAGSTSSSSLSSIASLTKSIDGMYLGLKFTK